MAKLIKMIAIGMGLVSLLIGCARFKEGRFYVGTWPLGSDLSYEQKEEVMERRNMQLELERARFPGYDATPLLTYDF